MEFSEYVDARRTTLIRAAVLLGQSTPDAEDLVQATLTKANRSWGRLQREDNIDDSVFRILIEAVNDRRRLNGEYTSEAPPEISLDLDGLDQSPGWAARRALVDMDPEHRDVLILSCFLGLSEATTAELLDLPESMVHVDDESWSRNLVHEASETIDVAPVAFIPTPHARRARWLGVAAASVALLIGAGIVLGWWSTDEKPDDVVPASEHQVPLVFGYDANSARQLLEAKGWEVTSVDAASCEPIGRAVATVPQAGATPKSSRVKLLVSVPADNLGCGLGEGKSNEQRALAWAVLDFARSGSPLEFSDDVTVFVNGRRSTMSADEAMKRNKIVMRLLVGVLSDDAKAVRVEGGTWTTPLLTTQIDRGDSLCGGLDLPKGFGSRESILMEVTLPTPDGTPGGNCHYLNVFITDGAVDGLVLRTGRIDTPEGPTAAVQNVVGLDVKDARKALRTDGFTVDTEKSDGCPGTTVVEQMPEAGVIAKYGSEVHLEIGREAANTCL